jgi:hypothetical protein
MSIDTKATARMTPSSLLAFDPGRFAPGISLHGPVYELHRHRQPRFMINIAAVSVWLEPS